MVFDLMKVFWYGFGFGACVGALIVLTIWRLVKWFDDF